MTIIEDKEFGKVTVRKSSRSHTMKATVAPNGVLRLSVPSYAPIFMVKRMIASSRSELRALMDTRPQVVISDGQSIGKSHSMSVRTGHARSIRTNGLQLIITLAPQDDVLDPSLIEEVRSKCISLLRKEAKAHLPKRIKYISEQFGFNYSSLRFTHSSSRWGSCNSKKAISLNIALMNIPFELIDYVLIHELVHTVHLNHSKEFWAHVSSVDPDYQQHKKLLKTFNPHI